MKKKAALEKKSNSLRCIAAKEWKNP